MREKFRWFGMSSTELKAAGFDPQPSERLKWPLWRPPAAVPACCAGWAGWWHMSPAVSGQGRPQQPSQGFCIRTFYVTWKLNRFGIQYRKELLQFLFVFCKVASQKGSAGTWAPKSRSFQEGRLLLNAKKANSGGFHPKCPLNPTPSFSWRSRCSHESLHILPIAVAADKRLGWGESSAILFFFCWSWVLRSASQRRSAASQRHPLCSPKTQAMVRQLPSYGTCLQSGGISLCCTFRTKHIIRGGFRYLATKWMLSGIMPLIWHRSASCRLPLALMEARPANVMQKIWPVGS